VQFVDLNEEQAQNLQRLLKIAHEAGPELKTSQTCGPASKTQRLLANGDSRYFENDESG
jgi:hypothetical protein